MENGKQRDLVDWIHVGAAVFSAAKLNQIANPPIDWAKVNADIKAAELAKEEQDIHFDTIKLTRAIEELPDNVYGYFTLSIWYRKLRDDIRPLYYPAMKELFDLCEARMRWMLKQFNPIQARRAQEAAKTVYAVQLMKYFWMLHLQGQWLKQCQSKNLMRFLCVGSPIAVLVGVLMMAFGNGPLAPSEQAMFVVLGLFALAVVMSLLFNGDPPKSSELSDLEASNLYARRYSLHVSEEFDLLVNIGAITREEADKKYVYNVPAASDILARHAGQFQDLDAQFEKEEKEFHQEGIRKHKEAKENERWAAKLEAEEVMRRRYYSGIVTI